MSQTDWLGELMTLRYERVVCAGTSEVSFQAITCLFFACFSLQIPPKTYELLKEVAQGCTVAPRSSPDPFLQPFFPNLPYLLL